MKVQNINEPRKRRGQVLATWILTYLTQLPGSNGQPLRAQISWRRPRLSVHLQDLHGTGPILFERIVSLRWLAPLAPHDPIECRKIGLLAPLGEEGDGVHGSKLFPHRRSHELIDAYAVRLRASLNLRLDRERQTQRIDAVWLLHLLILLTASIGASASTPNWSGNKPKSRRLKVTMAAALPFTAASSTSSPPGSRSRGRHTSIANPFHRVSPLHFRDSTPHRTEFPCICRAAPRYSPRHSRIA
jgi:hypothetical protein